MSLCKCVYLYSFRSDSDESLVELQTREWDPVIDWFNQRFVTIGACIHPVLMVHVHPVLYS